MTKSKSASSTSRHCAAVRSPASAEALMSKPAEKARPAPRTMTAPTPSSVASTCSARFVSSINSGSKALRTCGRLNGSQPIPSRIAIRRAFRHDESVAPGYRLFVRERDRRLFLDHVEDPPAPGGGHRHLTRRQQLDRLRARGPPYLHVRLELPELLEGELHLIVCR